MPSDSSQCPTTKQLRQWLDGEQELDPSQIAHVQTCGRCAQSLANLSDDASLQQLAQGVSSPSPLFSNEPELARLRTRLSELPIDDYDSRDSDSHDSDADERARALDDPPTTRPAELQPTDADTDAAVALDTLSIGELQSRLPAQRFIVDRLLATGGSGAVYLAYDQSLQREVAIKVLARDSLRDRQRFMREARLLAELEHPNVVRVFDFGTLTAEQHSSLPEASGPSQLFLVMEYVSGGTALRLRLNQSDASAAPMNYQRVATLLASAADGLAAAHQRGLVHRDVKPGNLLLVTDWSAMKVADFGLARSADQDATQVTRTGDLLGTPDFMSPEQVNEQTAVTASSDIYSLGATLYQLLTGLTPYQGGPAAVLRQIVDSSPVAPRLIAPAIPADLETICLHAMQAEPSARYASMQLFAQDLRAFASGEAIQARPISTTTKAIRFLKRNKSFTAALLVSLMLMTLLTAGSLVAAIVFRDQNQQLIVAAASEKAAKRSAEEALKASMTAADQLLLAVTTETEFLPRAPGSQEVARKLLERARDYFRTFLDANAGNPTLTYQLARAHAGLGEVAVRMGDTATLERETEAALALIDLIPEDELAPAQRVALKTDTLLVMANHLTESGEAKRAIPLLEEAVQSCEKLLPASVDEHAPASPATGSAPTGQHNEALADKRDLRASHALAKFGLGNALTWIGRRDEALPLIEHAGELFEKLRIDQPNNPTHLRSAAACHITMATIAIDMDKAADSKPHLQSALQLLNEVKEDNAIALRIREMKVKVLTNLALAERRMGNNMEAKTNYELAIAETRRLIELEPGVPSHQWNLVVAALNSGGPEMELGNLEPLVERWQATVPVLDKLIGLDPGNQRYRQVKAMLQSNIAIILRDMGKLDEAIAPLQAATTTLREQAEKLDFSSEAYLPVALNHYELASTFIQLERWSDAEQALDASDKIVDEILDKDPDFTPARGHQLDAQHARLQMFFKQPGSDIAVRRLLADQSLELARQLASTQADVAEFQVEVPRALNDLARVQLDAAEYTAAGETARTARGLLDTILADQDPDTASPEWRQCRKNVCLIEARSLLGADSKSIDAPTQTKVDELMKQARQFGATEEDTSPSAAGGGRSER